MGLLIVVQIYQCLVGLRWGGEHKPSLPPFQLLCYTFSTNCQLQTGYAHDVQNHPSANKLLPQLLQLPLKPWVSGRGSRIKDICIQILRNSLHYGIKIIESPTISRAQKHNPAPRVLTEASKCCGGQHFFICLQHIFRDSERRIAT